MDDMKPDRAYALAGLVCVTGGAFGLPIIFILDGSRGGFQAIYTSLAPILEWWGFSLTVIGALAGLYLVDDLIHDRALHWHRVSRAFFWLSFWFWLGKQALLALAFV